MLARRTPCLALLAVLAVAYQPAWAERYAVVTPKKAPTALADLEQALRADGRDVMTATATRDAAKTTGLDTTACDQPACLSKVGASLGVTHVIYTEEASVGGQALVYLHLVNVAKATRVRQVTFDPNNKTRGGAVGAIVELITPDKYLGRLALRSNIAGAAVFVDGKRMGVTPLQTTDLTVGAHALRVTHPEHRDSVQFVDIAFAQTTDANVELREIDAIDAHVIGTRVVTQRSPWYSHWGVKVAGIVVLAGVAGYIGYEMTNDIDADLVRGVR